MPMVDASGPLVKNTIIAINLIMGILFLIFFLIAISDSGYRGIEAFLFFLGFVAMSFGVYGSARLVLVLVGASVAVLIMNLVILVVLAIGDQYTKSPKGVFAINGPLALINTALYLNIKRNALPAEGWSGIPVATNPASFP